MIFILRALPFCLIGMSLGSIAEWEWWGWYSAICAAIIARDLTYNKQEDLL